MFPTSKNKFPWTNMHGFNLDWVIETVKSYTSKVDELDTEIQDIGETYETKENITVKRQLSEKGNFTGTWFDNTFTTVYTMILSALELSEEIRDKLNSNESIEYVVDGGIYGDTTPPTIEFDGGDY